MSDPVVNALKDFKQSLNEYNRRFNWTDPIDWIQRYFYLYDTKQLLELEPCQAVPLREALRRDITPNDWNFVYDTILWSWMKKSAKSTIIAAVCDYIAYHIPNASIKLIGNDLKQADSRVGMYMRSSILLGSKMGYLGDTNNRMREYRKNTVISKSGYSIVYPNGSRVEMVPIDPRGEAGGNDDIVVFSELWGWKHKSHQDMWAEMTISPNRYGKAQRWIDTYAGYEGESPILENLYQTLVIEGTKIEFEENPECYVNGSIFGTWVTRPLLKWQTDEYYESEKQNLDEQQFLRMHRNTWVTSVSGFISIDKYDKGGYNLIRPLGEYEEVVIGMDGAIHNDSFAIVAISRFSYRDDYSRILAYARGALEPDIFVKRFARAWVPPENGTLQFDGPDSPAEYLREITRKYNVLCVSYDEYQLAHFAQEMEAELGVWFDPFSQQTEREKADKYLYDLLVGGRFLHDGKDERFRDHVKAANKKLSGIDDNRIRIVKRNPKDKIDLVVAASMACWRAKDLIPR